MIRGFTLVELVIAIAVAGIVISGVVVTSAQLAEQTADPMMSVQRLHIAKAYLDEISAQEFALIGSNCTAPAGGRSDFTHMCQYRTLSNVAVTDQFGNAPPGLSSYTVSVDVSTDVTGNSRLGVGGAYVPASETAVVTVTVVSVDGASSVLSGYFVNGS